MYNILILFSMAIIYIYISIYITLYKILRDIWKPYPQDETSISMMQHKNMWINPKDIHYIPMMRIAFFNTIMLGPHIATMFLMEQGIVC